MVEKARIFHCVDVHGSEMVWRKILSIPKLHKVNVILVSGDLTGKLIIPIIEESPGNYKTMVYGRWMKASGEDGLRKLIDKITFSGFYVHVCDQKEYDELKNSPKKVEELFNKYMKERLKRWLDSLEEKIPRDVTFVMMPGNDDSFEIDEMIKSYEDRVIYPLGKVINICLDYQMLSFEWVNPTPWNTPREAPEEELWKKLEKIRDIYSGDWRKVILNFHCPPYCTKLDLAPKLDKNLKPVVFLGGIVYENVGSKSIRRFIEENQPLLSLHGHIHESFATDYVGKTLAMNPGSEYSEGVLRGFLIDITKDGVDKWWKIEG